MPVLYNFSHWLSTKKRTENDSHQPVTDVAKSPLGLMQLFLCNLAYQTFAKKMDATKRKNQTARNKENALNNIYFSVFIVNWISKNA